MSPRRYSPSGCQSELIYYVITMTKNTTKDKITEIKTILNRQKYINILFVGMLFLIALLVVFCIPKYAYETTTETVTIGVGPNKYAYTGNFLDLELDDSWIEKAICDNGVTIKEHGSWNDGTHYVFYNPHDETKKCMIRIETKTRVIK